MRILFAQQSQIVRDTHTTHLTLLSRTTIIIAPRYASTLQRAEEDTARDEVVARWKGYMRIDGGRNATLGRVRCIIPIAIIRTTNWRALEWLQLISFPNPLWLRVWRALNLSDDLNTKRIVNDAAKASPNIEMIDARDNIYFEWKVMRKLNLM